ncbi:MAG TPA: DUF1634 domain-containing protein [Terriglobia bacterium]|nr:DUF1634 domain-containing protein [Terriglobia bacterium]
MAVVESSAETNGRKKTIRQQDMDLLIGYLLLYGVLLSLALITAGLVWRYFRTGNAWLDYQISGMNLFQFVMQEFKLTAHAQLRPRLLVNLGIAVLMLTPFIRVAASVVYFMAVLKNWKYTVFTLIVLVVLSYSLFLRS